MTTELTRLDRAILNAFQGGFPLVENPFEPAAAALRTNDVDVTASTLRDRLTQLKETDVLSRFGPIYNANAIGGKTSLAAMHVPTASYSAVTKVVNSHPEVAHNYRRDHYLNMWFVLSVTDPARIEIVLDDIEETTGLPTYLFPKRHEFHLRARFPIDGPFFDAGIDLSDLNPPPATGDSSLTSLDRELIEATQDGLPITDAPYEAIASSIGVSLNAVLRRLAALHEHGAIRRIGVIPNHYALGYTENGMTVWDVPDADIKPIGEAVGRLPFVSHCYERPRHPGVWPYNLFAMVHGRSTAEARERIQRIHDTVAEHTSLTSGEWDVLYSTQLLKKTGLRLADRAKAKAP